MDMTCLNELMEPLQGPDLDQAHLDLPSWLLEDEAQMGFCHGAKEMHSLYSGVVGHASPPFITSGRRCPDLDIYDQIDWKKPLSLEDCFPQDLKEQSKSLQAAHDTTVAFAATPERQNHELTSPAPAVVNGKLLTSGEQPSPEVLLHWSGGIPAFVPPKESDLTEPEFIHASPQVISVPISDAVPEQHIASVETDSSRLFKSETPPVVIVKRIPTSAFSQSNEPQKIVINLKRVSVPPKSSTPVPNASVFHSTSAESYSHVNEARDSSSTDGHLSPAPTLKEVLSRDDTQDQILDLLRPIPLQEPVSPCVSVADDLSQSVGSVDAESSFGEHISLASPSAESIGAEMTYEELTEDSGVFLLSPESFSGEQALSPPQVTSSYKAVKPSGRKPRASPYSPLEKKLRKKEQNKRAALRYRQKKKEEEDGILSLLQKEEARQKDLKEKYESLQMEMRLLKNLMREVIAKKKFSQF